MQQLYDFLIANIISLIWAGWIKMLNGQHMAPGPQFAHACFKAILE